jgi:hypothetical protein
MTGGSPAGAALLQWLSIVQAEWRPGQASFRQRDQIRLIDFVVSILQSEQRNSTLSIVPVNMIGIVLIFIGASHCTQSGGMGTLGRISNLS